MAKIRVSEKFIGTKEVAEIYGKTIREVQYAIEKGYLKPTKMGKALIFNREKFPPMWMVRPKRKNHAED